MLLVDVHAHLDLPQFETDLDKVINDARKAGVKTIITNGTNHESNLEVLEIAKKYPDIVKAALGMYPIDATNVAIKDSLIGHYQRETVVNVDETLGFIKKMRDQVFAVGEVGIDLKESDDLKTQQENFQKVIDLAKHINKPIIVHTRNAEREVVEQLISSGYKKVCLHSFMARRSVIKMASDAGFSFSIPPLVVRNEQFQMLVDMVNINQLLTETDSPYLGPVMNERNEPANVLESVKKIAEIKGFDVEETANSIFMNYQRMFE
jgi:TatD DNase family protein